MAEITITFPDASTKQYPSGTTALEIATGISEGLARECVVAAIDGALTDLHAPIEKDAKLELIKFDDPRGKEVFWHTTSHVLAQAVKRLYPDARPTLGPPIGEGFYYDFDDLDLKEEDLEKIEQEMARIVKEDHSSERVEYASKEKALAEFGSNPYKKEIIEQSDEDLSAYRQGEFIDLCRGPHLPRTGMINAIKLTRLAGAYWRGDAKNAQLTRIYGISFPDKKELKKHLDLIEEAKKRDHRRIGKELDLYGFEEVSPGSPFFYPKGTVIYNELLKFIREEYEERGYQEVITPLLYDKALWEQSGHWEHYRENMFVFEDETQTMSLKPMNCPSHCLIYNRHQHSYRDLPVRIADFAALHRNELRGTLGGLTRVRKLSQDDAHIFCTGEQIEEEINALIDFTKHIYLEVMDMAFDHVELSTRPEKFLGEIETWNAAEKSLKKVLDKSGLDYVINEGDGAFYGPKIDFHIKDALGRTWQTATIQLDYQLPQRFGCEYTGEDNAKHGVVMIHRALLGSLERFMGVLIEHYAGRLPFWLSPEQAAVVPISEEQYAAAQQVHQELLAAGIRSVLEEPDESLNKRIREYQLRQIPAVLVIGDKEIEAGTVAVRTLDGKTAYGVTQEEFLARAQKAIAERSDDFRNAEE